MKRYILIKTKFGIRVLKSRKRSERRTCSPETARFDVWFCNGFFCCFVKTGKKKEGRRKQNISKCTKKNLPTLFLLVLSRRNRAVSQNWGRFKQFSFLILVGQNKKLKKKIPINCRWVHHRKRTIWCNKKWRLEGIHHIPMRLKKVELGRIENEADDLYEEVFHKKLFSNL